MKHKMSDFGFALYRAHGKKLTPKQIEGLSVVYRKKAQVQFDRAEAIRAEAVKVHEKESTWRALRAVSNYHEANAHALVALANALDEGMEL